MRWAGITAALLGVATSVAVSVAAAAPMTPLKLFSGDNFTRGEWNIQPLDAYTRNTLAHDGGRCLVSPDALIHAGYGGDTQNCIHTIVEDSNERAVVIYSCRGRGSGRTTIIRDGRNRFTVDAQGIYGSEPFALRSEYVRAGNCKAAAR